MRAVGRAPPYSSLEVLNHALVIREYEVNLVGVYFVPLVKLIHDHDVQKVMLQLTPSALCLNGERLRSSPITAGSIFMLRSLDMSNSESDAST